MAVAGRKIDEYTSLGTPTGNTRLVVVHNGNTYQVNVAILFNNCSANLSLSNSAVFTVNTMVVSNHQTPANSTITVTKGTFLYDNSYIYIAIANNVLKRVALDSF